MLIMPKFRVSLFSLALMLAVPFAPQAVAETVAPTPYLLPRGRLQNRQPLPPRHNRKLPPVAR